VTFLFEFEQFSIREPNSRSPSTVYLGKVYLNRCVSFPGVQASRAKIDAGVGEGSAERTPEKGLQRGGGEGSAERKPTGSGGLVNLIKPITGQPEKLAKALFTVCKTFRAPVPPHGGLVPGQLPFRLVVHGKLGLQKTGDASCNLRHVGRWQRTPGTSGKNSRNFHTQKGMKSTHKGMKNHCFSRKLSFHT
jgi:hypothetical protein